MVGFVADYKAPSIHVTKSRVWAMRQFYHFLTLHRIVPKNIATGIPYPKIEKTVPQFLTENEYKRLIRHFTEQADSSMGLRNLIIIMLLGTLGLRTSTLTALNIEDIELMYGTIWVREKGRQHRSMVLPHSLCKMIHKYLQPQCHKKGPLFLSIRKKRISPRTLQDIFRSAADQVGIDKKLHARLFRHTAATHLTKVAGTDITQAVLGQKVWGRKLGMLGCLGTLWMLGDVVNKAHKLHYFVRIVMLVHDRYDILHRASWNQHLSFLERRLCNQSNF